MAPVFVLDFQPALLWIPGISFPASSTGLSPSLAPLSSGLRIAGLSPAQVQTPHPHMVSHARSVCPVPLSVALTNGIEFLSFPAGTEMLQFSASPFAKRMDNQEVPLGYAGFKGCMRLPRPYSSLPLPSSVSKPSHPPYSVCVLCIRQE